MIKHTRFKDIPEFTRGANYRINVPWTSLKETLDRWGERGHTPVILNPDFQRGHVWDDAKRIKFVEFCLRGGRTAREIYWNCSSWQKDFNTPIELVDGKQRLEAVFRFLNNEIRVFGSLFMEFEDRMRSINDDFIFYVNDLKTRKEVLTWYLEMNENRVAHTAKELQKVKDLLAKEK